MQWNKIPECTNNIPRYDGYTEQRVSVAGDWTQTKYAIVLRKTYIQMHNCLVHLQKKGVRFAIKLKKKRHATYGFFFFFLPKKKIINTLIH